MAAGQGFKTFTTGEVLTAGDVNGYLMQGINVFTNATARDAAITAPAEGQFAFTKDNNSLWYYDGAAWVASGATGDIEGVTAGVGITGGGTSGTVTVTNSMATAIDAKGDLVPGTGADTFARLAVGANDTVLTADSSTATGLKWATPASGGSSFTGAAIYNNTSLSVSSGTTTTMTFNLESFDTNSFHDNSTNNSRFTIPTGKAGYYELSYDILYQGYNNNHQVRLSIFVNGAQVQLDKYGNLSSVGELNFLITRVMNLSVGDYVEVKCYQDSGITRDFYVPSNQGQASIKYLGA